MEYGSNHSCIQTPKYLFLTAGFLISSLGTIMNILTIIVFLKYVKVISITIISIVNLSIVDLLICGCSLPTLMVEYLIGFDIRDGWQCKFRSFINRSLMGTCLISLAILSISRLLTVADFPYFNNNWRKKTLIGIIITLSWLIPFTAELVLLYDITGYVVFEETICICVAKFHSVLLQKMLEFIAFLFPCFINLFCYINIFLITARSRKQITKLNEKTKFSKAEAKLTKIILLVIAMSIACYLPFIILKGSMKGDSYPSYFMILAIMPTFVHSCISPFLYMLSKQFRHSYRQFFKSCSRNGISNKLGSNDVPHNSTGSSTV